MTTVIEAKDLVKTYHSGRVESPALKGVSLKIKSGEFLIITGRSGSGKSTFMHQVALLDRPTSGDILMDDKSVVKLSERERMNLRLSQIGYIFQEYALIGELTALQNVMLPHMMRASRKDSASVARDLLRRVGLDGKFERLPSELSGGEQQRVAIARALVNSPKIIFADEPTANLDSIASNTIMELFKSLNDNENITILMVTHEPEELRYASRNVIFADGRISA